MDLIIFCHPSSPSSSAHAISRRCYHRTDYLVAKSLVLAEAKHFVFRYVRYPSQSVESPLYLSRSCLYTLSPRLCATLMSLDYQHSQLIELAMHPSSRRRRKKKQAAASTTCIRLLSAYFVKSLSIVCQSFSIVYQDFNHCL